MRDQNYIWPKQFDFTHYSYVLDKMRGPSART